MKYLDPKADLTFKKVFGEHPDLVMSLLNALLPLNPGEEITSIAYLPSELVPENPLRKNSIVDVRCTDKLGRQFLTEMQMVWSPEFRQRVLFNASKAYVRQIDVGEEYRLLQPVYSLNLVNEVFEENLPGYYHHYAMIHVEHSEKVIEGLQLIFVELPKFSPKNFTEKKMLVLWLRFLTEINAHTVEAPKELLSDPVVSKALKAVKESAFSQAQLYSYEKFWDIISVEKTLYYGGVRRGIAEGLVEGKAKGLAEGLAEGLAKGIAKGIAEGLAKGKAEGKAKGIAEGLAKGKAEGIAEGQRRIASQLKEQGIAPELIAQCTGLSVEEVGML